MSSRAIFRGALPERPVIPRAGITGSWDSAGSVRGMCVCLSRAHRTDTAWAETSHGGSVLIAKAPADPHSVRGDTFTRVIPSHLSRSAPGAQRRECARDLPL